MMKNLTQVFAWFVVVAISMTCFISTVLVMIDGSLIHLAGYAIFFPSLLTWSSLLAVTFGSITASLTASYIYIVNRSANKARVRLIYAVIRLLVAFAFVFAQYEHRHEQLTIRDICTQFDLAVGRRDYETAYELMSPDYRQTHSPAQFIDDYGRRITCRQRDKSIKVVLVHPGARNASVIRTPFGSLNTEIFLEKMGENWYFTGKIITSRTLPSQLSTKTSQY